MPRSLSPRAATATVIGALLLVAGAASAHDPEYTSDLDRDRCTFTSVGSHPYFPLWPGYSLLLEGEEEDDGETVEIAVQVSVLDETETVDGIDTRVLEEREWEDEELVEVSRNFLAVCRETGDIWYFGEDVDDYEDGEVVGHGGAWRAGENGNQAGILMPGSPLVGARFQQEQAPGIAEDRAEVVSLSESLEVPAGSYENVLLVLDSAPDTEPGEEDEKYYAPGVGLIRDETIELVEIELPDCMPDATTLCLNNGRFQVTAHWVKQNLDEGEAMANLVSDDSGELWFFSADNVELLVKVIDACDYDGFNNYWVFAAGLTNVEVTLTVVDTATDDMQVYTNPLGNPFDPVLDTDAFDTCDE